MESMSWFWQDLRYGVRSLRKDRGFSLLAMFALALGIGATTVIFSVLDNVLLEPFAYRDSDRLTGFFIHDSSHADQEGRGGFFIAEYLDFKEQNHVFGIWMFSTPTKRARSSSREAKPPPTPSSFWACKRCWAVGLCLTTRERALLRLR